MAKKSAVRVTPSTGNVFRDLGFSKEESEHLLVRADLLIQVQKAIASRRLKQAQAAKVLRVTQPRVSDLLRGRLDLFSTDALLDMLARLGPRGRGEIEQAAGAPTDSSSTRDNQGEVVSRSESWLANRSSLTDEGERRLVEAAGVEP
jgi:predicted XRE-type DNA-binding protein